MQDLQTVVSFSIKNIFARQLLKHRKHSFFQDFVKKPALTLPGIKSAFISKKCQGKTLRLLKYTFSLESGTDYFLNSVYPGGETDASVIHYHK